MHRFAVLLLSLLVALVGENSARALTAIPRDFHQLVVRADTVFKGTVTTKISQWIGEGAASHIVTFVTFQVEETYKGQASAEQKLRFLGGTVGNDTMEVPDMPRFEIGQKAVLFVVGNGKQFCPLVGVAQGRFHVVRDDATGQERVLTNGKVPVVDTDEIGRSDDMGRTRAVHDESIHIDAITIDEFKAAILGEAATLPTPIR